MTAKKIVYGQFYTKDNLWLKPQIVNFIKSSNQSIIYDPFAGEGDLLSEGQRSLGFKKTKGYDIDRSLCWDYNDSLINIPHIDDAIIITNPPYLTNYSASRKKIADKYKKYFENSVYDDLYLIALDRMLEAQQYVVAIIPETFINSNYKKKNLLSSLTILEENLFNDTETPVLVACFDGREKDLQEVEVFKNDRFINNLANLEKMRLIPEKDVKMSFNSKEGWLAVRCVDTTNPNEKLSFGYKEKFDYDWNKGIKCSSRLLTLIQIDVAKEKREEFINQCNQILSQVRQQTEDVILSPFKGNMKDGTRRRRLDFLTCRAIVELAYKRIM